MNPEGDVEDMPEDEEDEDEVDAELECTWPNWARAICEVRSDETSMLLQDTLSPTARDECTQSVVICVRDL